MKSGYLQSDLKISNRRLAYEYLRKNRSVSRAEMGRTLGISGATIIKKMIFFCNKILVNIMVEKKGILELEEISAQ